MELATLTGSEKQITWARDIRDAMLAAIDEHLIYCAKYDDTLMAEEDQRARNYLVSQTEASWFIDRRMFGSGDELATRLLSEMSKSPRFRRGWVR